MFYYAMMNRYATETSDGFQNTWYPVVFKSRLERDDVVKRRINAARLLTPEERKVLKGRVRAGERVTEYSEVSRRIARL